jgi:acetyl-CoA carboxylase biotin carboxylase subunit
MKVLVANRGEVAVRILRTCRSLGFGTVLVVSTADRDSLGATVADEVLCMGGPRPRDSYLRADTIVHAALATGCDAIHPGYGFLSENVAFAELCAEHGVRFIGPRPEHLRLLGDKGLARTAAAESGIPVVPGRTVADIAEALAVADDIGYPVMIKALYGGGGRGMKRVQRPEDLADAFALAAAEAAASFGDGSLLLERFVQRAKHVEVQVARDRHGTSVHLGERDCSIQFRYQKMIEETPCVALSAQRRARLARDATTLVDRLDYENVGTVEFLVDLDSDEQWFLEMNPRIQVEHPVTEMVTGLDIVALQFAIAVGERIDLSTVPDQPDGHAIELRVSAQSATTLAPSPGRITRWKPPRAGGVRVDSHGYPGYLFPPFYDALLAKVVVHALDRPTALTRAADALADFDVDGIETNLPLLRDLLRSPALVDGTFDTGFLTRHLEAVGTRG